MLDEPEWLLRAAQEVSVVVSAAPEVSHRSAEAEFRHKAECDAHGEFRHTAGREAHHEFRHMAGREARHEFRHKAHHAGPPLPPPRPPHPETSPETSPEIPPETPAATAAEFRHTEAEEGHVGAESSAHLGAHELGLHARLSSAYAEAER
jgi:hypothetical protein